MDVSTCSTAAEFGHFHILQWARLNLVIHRMYKHVQTRREMGIYRFFNGPCKMIVSVMKLLVPGRQKMDIL